MHAFEYTPLNNPEDDIRLVRILRGRDEDGLQCTLVHCPLPRKPLTYSALSYTWNDSHLFSEEDLEKTERLVVNNDASLMIRRNLASYFRHVRDSLADESEESWPIWIDALCINQQDIKERNAQVPRMREIYKLASIGVTAWLGPETDDSTVALQFIKKIGGLSQSQAQNFPGTDRLDFSWWMAEEMSQLERDILSGVSVPQWQAVNNLFSRAWWCRTWVVQEGFMAQRLEFMCGKETIDWVILWQLLENLWGHSDWTRRVVPNGSTLIAKSSPGRTILWLRQKKDQLDFLKTLYHLRPSRATNPMDKVYGVLGLAIDAKLVVPSPDYSLTMEEVYLKLLQSMTDVRGDLDWLTLAGDLGEELGFPSWCPDLTRNPPRVSMNTSRSMQDGKNCGFFAAKDTLPLVQFTSSPMTCAISGFIVDTVDGLGPGQSAKDAAADTVPSRFRNRAYETDSDLYDAIWTSIVADQDFEGTPESWRAPKSFGSIFGHHSRIAEPSTPNMEDKTVT